MEGFVSIVCKEVEIWAHSWKGLLQKKNCESLFSLFAAVCTETRDKKFIPMPGDVLCNVLMIVNIIVIYIERDDVCSVQRIDVFLL